MWKLASHIMVVKVPQIASWVPMCLLPWAQCKRWIPIGLMGCVHTHQKTLEGWGSPNHIWNVMQKTRKNNWKTGKTG